MNPGFTNVVVTTQPVVAANSQLVTSVHGHRGWNTELMGCFQDCGQVIKAMCCLECMICGINGRIGECACAHWIVPGALINARTKVRTLGGIQGTMVNDCCVVSFCGPCAVCQMERELDTMGL